MIGNLCQNTCDPSYDVLDAFTAIDGGLVIACHPGIEYPTDDGRLVPCGASEIADAIFA